MCENNKLSKTAKCGSAKEGCPHGAKIVSVEFLDGDDNTEISSKSDQFVNIERKQKWVDGKHVKNIDRLGQKPRVKVRFDKKGTHKFEVKLVPDANNITYTEKELKRNTNGRFKMEENWKPGTTKDDGTLIIEDLFISAAGGNIHTLIAKDAHKNQVKSTHGIVTRRLIYCQECEFQTIPTTHSI